MRGNRMGGRHHHPHRPLGEAEEFDDADGDPAGDDDAPGQHETDLRASTSHRTVAAPLVEADGDGPQLPAQLNEPVTGALGLEVVACLGQRQAGCLAQLFDHGARESRRGVDAGPDRSAAQYTSNAVGSLSVSSAR